MANFLAIDQKYKNNSAFFWQQTFTLKNKRGGFSTPKLKCRGVSVLEADFRHFTSGIDANVKLLCIFFYVNCKL